MNKRPVDKTNKKNVYCSHCKFYFYDKVKNRCVCVANKRESINYWNRCKDFEWHEKYEVTE